MASSRFPVLTGDTATLKVVFNAYQKTFWRLNRELFKSPQTPNGLFGEGVFLTDHEWAAAFGATDPTNLDVPIIPTRRIRANPGEVAVGAGAGAVSIYNRAVTLCDDLHQAKETIKNEMVALLGILKEALERPLVPGPMAADGISARTARQLLDAIEALIGSPTQADLSIMMTKLDAPISSSSAFTTEAAALAVTFDTFALIRAPISVSLLINYLVRASQHLPGHKHALDIYLTDHPQFVHQSYDGAVAFANQHAGRLFTPSTAAYVNAANGQARDLG